METMRVRIMRNLGRIASLLTGPILTIRRPIPNTDYPPTTLFMMEVASAMPLAKGRF